MKLIYSDICVYQSMLQMKKMCYILYIYNKFKIYVYIKIYIYIYLFRCIYSVYIYIYIYTYIDRELDKDISTKRLDMKDFWIKNYLHFIHMHLLNAKKIF